MTRLTLQGPGSYMEPGMVRILGYLAARITMDRMRYRHERFDQNTVYRVEVQLADDERRRFRRWLRTNNLIGYVSGYREAHIDNIQRRRFLDGTWAEAATSTVSVAAPAAIDEFADRLTRCACRFTGDAEDTSLCPAHAPRDINRDAPGAQD